MNLPGVTCHKLV